MTILLTTVETWFLYIGIVLGVILALGLIFFLTCGLRSKREKKEKIERVIVDEEFINAMLNGLGSIENISCVSIDNGRIKFKVNDLDVIKPDELKTLSTSGVFITGNNVKLLFKYDSKDILNLLVERGVKEC